MKRLVKLSFAVALVAASAVPALAASSRAVAFEFVGNAKECGGDPGSRIVTGEWIRGVGLPDNGTQNDAPLARNNARYGLLLSKNGNTSVCASAGAKIVPRQPLVVGEDVTVIGFDIRKGSWCGAGAPRINVYVEGESQARFLGCLYGDTTDAPQDPVGWSRVRFDLTQSYPGFDAIAPGTTVTRIDIVLDEGTELPGSGMPGLAVIDNILIEPNKLITRPGQPINDPD